MGAAVARRLHIADSQTGADVQMAGAFWDGFFFLFFFFTSTPTIAQSQQPRPQLPPSIIYRGSPLISEPTVVRRNRPPPPPTGELLPCLAGGNDTVPSPVIHPQRASFGGRGVAHENGPRKVIRLIL